MTALAYNLFKANRELAWAKQAFAKCELAGKLDEKVFSGMADIYLPITKRERLQRAVDQCQHHVTEAATALRRDRVLTKWAWRKIHRTDRARTKTIPATSPKWFNAMGMDETIMGRRLTDWG